MAPLRPFLGRKFACASRTTFPQSFTPSIMECLPKSKLTLAVELKALQIFYHCPPSFQNLVAYLELDSETWRAWQVKIDCNVADYVCLSE